MAWVNIINEKSYELKTYGKKDLVISSVLSNQEKNFFKKFLCLEIFGDFKMLERLMAVGKYNLHKK